MLELNVCYGPSQDFHVPYTELQSAVLGQLLRRMLLEELAGQRHHLLVAEILRDLCEEPVDLTHFAVEREDFRTTGQDNLMMRYAA